MNKSESKGRNNCPNCGAPINSDICPYCGTRFVDFSSMSIDEPFWMKIKIRDRVLTTRVKLRSVNIKYPDPVTWELFGDYADSVYMDSCITESPNIEMELAVMPTDGIFYTEEVIRNE